MSIEPESLSDEASQDAADAKEVPRNTTAYWAWNVSWKECRRRAFAMLEKKDEIIEGSESHINVLQQTLAKERQETERLRRQVANLLISCEERERKAFEAGYNTIAIVSAEEAYRAFRAEEGK